MSKRIHKAFMAPIAHPNGLAASNDGLWMVDQETQDVVLTDWIDGRELHRVQTQSENSSGLAFDGTHLWVACNGREANKAILEVDAQSGDLLMRFPIPLDASSGVHGIEWNAGTLWVTSLKVRRLAQVKDSDWTLVHSIPFDHSRAHGLAWDNGSIWCVDTNDRAIYKLDARDGREVVTLDITEEYPEPHGLTIRNDVLWYCDATTGAICRIEGATS